MGWTPAQARRRKSLANCPHCCPGDVIRPARPTKRLYVDRAWRSYEGAGHERGQTAAFVQARRIGFALHRVGTTARAVDSVWTPMYESNQRSNNLNNES